MRSAKPNLIPLRIWELFFPHSQKIIQNSSYLRWEPHAVENFVIPNREEYTLLIPTSVSKHRIIINYKWTGSLSFTVQYPALAIAGLTISPKFSLLVWRVVLLQRRGISLVSACLFCPFHNLENNDHAFVTLLIVLLQRLFRIGIIRTSSVNFPLWVQFQSFGMPSMLVLIPSSSLWSVFVTSFYVFHGIWKSRYKRRSEDCMLLFFGLKLIVQLNINFFTKSGARLCALWKG